MLVSNGRCYQCCYRCCYSLTLLLLLLPPAACLQAERLPRRQVKTVGTWPSPLVIPEEVDELPNSDVPRGFICPITQVRWFERVRDVTMQQTNVGACIGCG